ncbi:hypothetical protein DDF62_22685 [Caulobacter radicis]|nr:hypothetical protein DDF62_22685 [Caulobacter radicis]
MLMGDYSPASAPDLPDPNDPRRGWTVGGGKAWNTVLNGPGQAEAQRIRSQRWNDTRYLHSGMRGSPSHF